jgi:hypothetical protein
VKGAIDGVIGGIKSALSFVSDLWSKITGANNAAAAIPAPAAAGLGFAAVGGSPSLARSGLLTPTARAATSSGGGGVSIVVNGALDPDAVARQIQSILRRRGRGTGGIVL